MLKLLCAVITDVVLFALYIVMALAVGAVLVEIYSRLKGL